MHTPKLRTALCARFGIDHPVWLAGMGSQGRATPPALVAAIAEAGGMGVIGGANLGADELRRVIRETRRLTSRPIGVHLVVPQPQAGGLAPSRGALRSELAQRFPEHVAHFERLLTHFGLPPVRLDDDVAISQAATADGGSTGPRGDPAAALHAQLDVVLSEDVQFVGGAMGPLGALAERARPRGLPVLGLVTSAGQAARYVEEGADVIVAQGAEAGGHVGSVSTLALLPQVLARVCVPVLAAGGIADGRGLAAVLGCGAEGGWIGTAFLVAYECDIPQAQKRQLIEGRAEDFAVNRVYSGSPMRGYRNEWVREWERARLATLPRPYQKLMMDDLNAAAAAAGRWDLHSNPAGEGAALVSAERPAADILAEMIRQAHSALTRCIGMLEPARGERAGATCNPRIDAGIDRTSVDRPPS